MHRPQPTHLSWSIRHFLSVITGALWAQIFAHLPQPTQLSVSTEGLPCACISILPARDPPPMPRFLSAPPKPACSWPLKCVSEMMISASMSARPIFAFFTYSPPTTGTSTSSPPRRPSAMITWQPVENGEKPLIYAASICSIAFFRLPT